MSVEIPEKIMERLKKRAKQFGVSVDELRQEMLEYLPVVAEEYPEVKSNIKRLQLAYRKLKARLEKEEGSILSPSIMYSAFFIGESGLQNTAEQMIAKIKRMPKEEQAKYHPDPNTWLDYREDRDTYMKPIEGVDHRTYYGIGSTGRQIDKSRVKFLKLEAWDKAATSLSPELGTVYCFRAIDRAGDRQLPHYELSASSVTRLRKLEVQPSPEELEWFIRNCGKEIYRLNDLEMVYLTHFKRAGRENREPVFIEADVYSIIFREDKQNIIGLDDEMEGEEYKAVGYLANHLPVKFKEADRLIILGELGEVTVRGTKSIVVFIKGYFKIPGTSQSIYFA